MFKKYFLNITSVVFLLVTLVTVTVTVNDPLKKQLVGVFAENNRAWRLSHQQEKKNEEFQAKQDAKGQVSSELTGDALLKARERTGTCAGAACLTPEIIKSKEAGTDFGSGAVADAQNAIYAAYQSALSGNAESLKQFQAGGQYFNAETAKQIEAALSSAPKTPSSPAPDTGKEIDCGSLGGKYNAATDQCLQFSTSKQVEKTDDGFITHTTTIARNLFDNGNIVDSKTVSAPSGGATAPASATPAPAPISALTSSIQSTGTKPLEESCNFNSECQSGKCGKKSVVSTSNSCLPSTQTAAGTTTQASCPAGTSKQCVGSYCSCLTAEQKTELENLTIAAVNPLSPQAAATIGDADYNIKNLNNYAIAGGNQTLNMLLTASQIGIDLMAPDYIANWQEANARATQNYNTSSVENSGLRSFYNYTLAFNEGARDTETVISTIRAGTNLTAAGAALSALPAAAAAGTAAAGTAGATALSVAGSTGASLLTSVGAITTMTQTSNAVTAHIQDPGSEEAWKQTVYAGLSWANLGTADMLVKGLGGAKLANTLVSAVNLVVDAPAAKEECSKNDKAFYSCGGAIAAVVADVAFGALDYKQGQLGFENPFKNVNNSLFIPSRVTDDAVKLAANSIPNAVPGSAISDAPAMSQVFAPPASSNIRDTTATFNTEDFFTPQRDLFESVDIGGSRIATEQELNLLLGSADAPGVARTTTVLNDADQIAAEFRIITPEQAQNIVHFEELNAAKKTEIDAVNDRLATFGGGTADDVVTAKAAPKTDTTSPIAWIGFRNENGSFQFPIGRKSTFTGGGDALNPTVFDRAAAKKETATILEDPAFIRIKEKAAELKKANESGISILTDAERAASFARSEYLASVSDGMIAKQAEFGRAARNARQNDLPPPRLTYDKLTEVVSSTPNERLSFTFDDIKMFVERYDYKGDMGDLKIFLDANGGTATRREILDFVADVEMGWDPRSSLAGTVTVPAIKETSGLVDWWDENVVSPLNKLIPSTPIKPKSLDEMLANGAKDLPDLNWKEPSGITTIKTSQISSINSQLATETGGMGSSVEDIRKLIQEGGFDWNISNNDPITAFEMPDGTYHIQTGRHRAEALVLENVSDVQVKLWTLADQSASKNAAPAVSVWDRAKQIISQIPETGGGLNKVGVVARIASFFPTPQENTLNAVLKAYDQYGERIRRALKETDGTKAAFDDLVAIAEENGYRVQLVGNEKIRVITEGKEVLEQLTAANAARISADGTTLYVLEHPKVKGLPIRIDDMAHDMGAILLGGKKVKPGLTPDFDPKYLVDASEGKISTDTMKKYSLFDKKNNRVPSTYLFDSLIGNEISRSNFDIDKVYQSDTFINKTINSVINKSAPMGTGFRAPVFAIASLGGLEILAGVDYVSENWFGVDLFDPIGFLHNLQLSPLNAFLEAPENGREMERLEGSKQELLPNSINQPGQTSGQDNASRVVFGDEFRPIDSTNKLNLQVIPTEIIIHWDGQPGAPSGWNTNTTFNGLSEVYYDPLTGLWHSADSHFGVDGNGVVQFLDMFGNTIQFSYGAKGYPNAINIEMAGSDFQIYADGTTNVPKEEIENTVNLIIQLMKQYNIPLENVFGHSERDITKDITYVLDNSGQPVDIIVTDVENPTDRSKPDPGTSFMQFLKDQVEDQLSNQDVSSVPAVNQTATSVQIDDGLYAQTDPNLANIQIPGGAGKPFKNIGCGQTAVANILCEYSSACPDPIAVSTLIPASEYTASGLTSSQSNIKILNDYGFTSDPFIGSVQYSLTNYMEPNDLLWITAKVGGIDHHTYFNGYSLDQNGTATYNLNDSYFGDGFKCTATGDSSFGCKNDQGTAINIGTENQNLYIIDVN